MHDLEDWQRQYDALDAGDRRREVLLGELARSRSPEHLARLARVLATNPPGTSQEVDRACRFLFQQPGPELAALFPELWDALAQRSVAALVLDLANFLFERGWARPHPAHDRVPALAALLRQIVERLGRIHEQAPSPDDATREQVGESIALFVALCRALALVANPSAAAALFPALDVAHRRLRTEAAAALAAVGEERGYEVLVEQAADIASRHRALVYLDELGQLSRAPEADRSPEARAAGMLAAWLAEPAQFGIAPSTVEHRDQRTQAWPGYELPQHCHLFHFEYHLPRGTLCGAGIVGPLLMQARGDWRDLAPEELYAYFAGWQAEHAEISSATIDELASEAPRARARLSRRLEPLIDDAYDVDLEIVGRFFGDEVWIASGTRAGKPGVLAADSQVAWWLPAGEGARPLGSEEGWCYYKGRRLLEYFNREPS